MPRPTSNRCWRSATPATRCLRKARDEGYFRTAEAVAEVREDADLRRLHEHPEFKQLFEELQRSTKQAS
jgi:hypothetical protein